jgi:RNA polymerase sigma-70 factor (ECF subfamily)
VEVPSLNLVARWRSGDQAAADELFHRYVTNLVALARTRLSAKMAARIDAEDVVQSAYRTFFVNAREGRYELSRGGDLWRLLVATTMHKLRDQVKHHRAQKRSIDSEKSFGSEDSLFGIQPEALAGTPSPIEALTLVDEIQEVMGRLDPLPRRVLELRLDGHNLDEIAAAIDRCPQTVRRTLERIKQNLREHQKPEAPAL